MSTLPFHPMRCSIMSPRKMEETRGAENSSNLFFTSLESFTLQKRGAFETAGHIKGIRVFKRIFESVKCTVTHEKLDPCSFYNVSRHHTLKDVHGKTFEAQKILYARGSRGPPGSRAPVVGGTAITEDQAIELRQVVFGSAACPPRGEWLRTPLSLRPPSLPLAFGLNAPRNATRGTLAAVGAHALKYLLFEDRPKDDQGKFFPSEILLRPDEVRQREALCSAVSEVIWRSGEQTKSVVALPQEIAYIQHSHTYYQDTITEKLHLYEFTKLEDLQIFIKRYMYMFEEEPGAGALLLVYAAVLSRGPQNIKKDLDGMSYLVSTHVEGSINLVMLFLTGRATPYLHNGIVYVGDEDHYALPQYGVLSRSTIGLLVWKGVEEAKESDRQPPGSRLKTPALPIWVTDCAGHYGMLFNTNRELLRNYHAERRFELQYYTCGGCHVTLTVDTRGLNEGGGNARDDINATPLEKLIHSKWQEAKISWTGQTPYVGETAVN